MQYLLLSAKINFRVSKGLSVETKELEEYVGKYSPDIG